ncbi:DUF3775 domain-containing protein [Rhodobacteraceae bacterium RKSG542]|uniref:DUF3775 domain-containing protein n=1 Tax=Pseudovibrio flavus TaxID=2529854 RepID=UPI0012BC6940|nr:DUF3775 domain-containing protein [Pseudovibrio flavus]MTI19059.1 DUF3775 domain-containing protein [Pseudovibrio flavus]
MTNDLNLSADSVRMIVQKVRAANSSLPDTYEAGHDPDFSFDPVTLGNAHHHDKLAEEEVNDLTTEEVRELLDDLNVDEAAELVAITWIGRGDFDASDFEVALLEAKERATGSTASYLLGLPHLADHLENGLDALNL